MTAIIKVEFCNQCPYFIDGFYDKLPPRCIKANKNIDNYNPNIIPGWCPCASQQVDPADREQVAVECDNMKEKTCSDCFNCESTYPLDPPGSLYCDVVEDYVSANGSCGSFKENAIQPYRQLNTDKAKLLKELDRIKGQLEEALTYKDAFRLCERAFDKKTKELELNKKMLARQCDLAREAETELEALRRKVQAIRDFDCGAWLATTIRGFDKRRELMGLLDDLYKTGLRRLSEP
uniref:Uncharacterized protein n=1 Tax=viral metagenome TaxID=1070528 RepID=A0A6M3JQ45_9ZZZZ